MCFRTRERILRLKSGRIAISRRYSFYYDAAGVLIETLNWFYVKWQVIMAEQSVLLELALASTDHGDENETIFNLKDNVWNFKSKQDYIFSTEKLDIFNIWFYFLGRQSKIFSCEWQ